MSEGKVLVEKEGAIAIVTFNRPAARNAFNREQRLSLIEALNDCNKDDAVRVVILAAKGKGFSAGADLGEDPEGFDKVSDQILGEYKPSLMAIHESSKLYIAAVNGAAAGIGSAFAMGCDFTLMEESAYIYQAFAAIALVPDGGATFHLVRTLGYKRAMQMIIEAEKMPAQECVRLGLANKVVADGTVLDAAKALAAKLALGAPLAQQHAKTLCKQALVNDLPDMIAAEAYKQDVCIQSKDLKEGVTAFYEKRQPVFKGC